MSPLRDPLRAPQVEVHRIAPPLDLLRRLEPLLLVVRTELDNERPVVRCDALDRVGRGVEHGRGVRGLRGEEGGVEHGSVAEVGAVETGEDAPGLRRVGETEERG